MEEERKMSTRKNRNSLDGYMMSRRVFVSVFVAVFVMVLASPAIAQVSSDAVLMLHFDEGSGTIAKDESGYENDGAIYGATWTTGISEKALMFDGEDDYVHVDDDRSLHFNDFTITFWTKTTSTQRSFILDKDTVGKGTQDYRFEYRSDGKIEPVIGMKGTDYAVTSDATIYDGSWHFCTVVRQGSTISVWVDGYLDKSETAATGLVHAAGAPLKIGKAYTGGKYYYFNGIIDELVIYSKALTPEEIKALYLAKRTGHPPYLTITKTPTPYSIKPEQTTTVKVTMKNTGNMEINDIEVVDMPPADFDLVSGDTSALYTILKLGESKTFEYTILSRDTGEFYLGQATATYADEEGKYHTVKSNSPMVEVLTPVEQSEIPAGEEEENGTPGFEVIFAFAGLLAVAYLLRMRK